MPGKKRTIGLSGSTEALFMSITDEFWTYAREAILSARKAKTSEDKQVLLDLAKIWTQAALEQRAST
jgi:hypothetical protein